MTIIEMLGQSGVLTLLGMGVVFGFLVILIITVTLVGRIIRALNLDNSGAPGAPPELRTAASPAALPPGDAALSAVIAAAVNEYRKTNP